MKLRKEYMRAVMTSGIGQSGHIPILHDNYRTYVIFKEKYFYRNQCSLYETALSLILVKSHLFLLPILLKSFHLSINILSYLTKCTHNLGLK